MSVLCPSFWFLFFLGVGPPGWGWGRFSFVYGREGEGDGGLALAAHGRSLASVSLWPRCQIPVGIDRRFFVYYATTTLATHSLTIARALIRCYNISILGFLSYFSVLIMGVLYTILYSFEDDEDYIFGFRW